MFLNYLFMLAQMNASCVVNCLVTFRHLGCIHYEGRCMYSAYLDLVICLAKHYTDLIDFILVAIRSLYKALYVLPYVQRPSGSRVGQSFGTIESLFRSAPRTAPMEIVLHFPR